MTDARRNPLQMFIATSNAGKLRDFATAAALFQIPVAVLPGLAEIPAPDEDGATFEENARIKAIAYSRARPGLLVVADDSGLEVDALRGEPGVRSARFAGDAGFAGGDDGTSVDDRNNLYLLERLQRAGAVLPSPARYRCVLAAARDGVCFLTASGAVEGVILSAPRGTGGFGYDPLFYLPEQDLTMAEIDHEARQSLSHRGRALQGLLEQLHRLDSGDACLRGRSDS